MGEVQTEGLGKFSVSRIHARFWAASPFSPNHALQRFTSKRLKENAYYGTKVPILLAELGHQAWYRAVTRT